MGSFLFVECAEHFAHHRVGDGSPAVLSTDPDVKHVRDPDEYSG